MKWRMGVGVGGKNRISFPNAKEGRTINTKFSSKIMKTMSP